ncbi:MAG: PEGA domain-containing protein [Candidatus Competibacteraceae bacterium]|nr:MAG: PEGA domain-containing protein [Candidatus Competibacteraceae bacterium]
MRDEVRRQLREAKAAPPPPIETKPSPDNSAKIATLLRNCDAHLRANRLTSGKGGNATDCYGEVLKLDQGNADALAGLDRIADRYAESAASAIQRGDAKAARGYLDRVARLNPGYPRLASLREQLTQAESATKSTPPPEPAPPKKTDLEPIDLVSTPQRTEPATPSTPARTGPAQLMVRSNVEDAEISINGRAIGTVPMQIEMKAGVYRVRVSQEGYIDWNGKVELTAGQEQTVQAVLKKKSEKSEPVADAAPPATPRKTPAPEAPPEPESADRNAEKRAAAPEPTPPARTPAPSETPTAKPGQAPNCLKGDCNNGSGTYRYPDGSEYSGDFRNAKMHGQGTYVYAGRGEKYVGDWRNGVINGQGTYYYRSGNRYEGDWRNGRKNGQGTYYYTDRGDKYVGDFKNDQPNGQGVYYYSNGDRYEGEWSNGRKNGQGVMYQNGMKIVGEWRNDQKVQVSVEQ